MGKIATTISNAGLLSKAEKDQVLSKLEKAGAFSTAEKLLPLADQLGALGIVEKAINSKPGGLSTTGVVLAAIGPLYAALASQGYGLVDGNDEPVVLLPGLLFTLTTGAGVAFISLANLISDLQGVGGKGPATISKPRIPLLSVIEKKRIATALSKAGLLSAAEKLLPIADDFKLLQALQTQLDKTPGDLFAEGAVVVLAGPVLALASLGGVGLAGGLEPGVFPIPIGGYALIPVAITAVFAGLGLPFLVLGAVKEGLEDADTPLELPEFLLPKAPNAKSRAVQARALPEAPVRQSNTFLRRGFTPHMLKRPLGRAPHLAQTSADTLGMPAVALIGLFAGCSIAFGFLRLTASRAIAAQF